MNAPGPGDHFPASNRPEQEKILNRFEDAWQSGAPPRLESFCPPLDPAAPTRNDPARLLLLRELVKIDLEYRWRGGATGPVTSPLEQYGERYPELIASEQLLLEMIGEEYWARHCWGDRPQHAEYLARFDRHRLKLLDLLRRVDAELAAEVVGEGWSSASGDPIVPFGSAGGKATMASPVISVPSLIDALRQHRLLSPEQLKPSVLGDLQRRSADPRALARQLMERGWLTAYQINQLFQGRGADLVVGPYLLLERLGEGGAGQVFKARHLHMDRLVALKLIRKELLTDPEIVARFHREVHALSKLTHPHVVHAYDAGPVGTNFFLAMEYVEGIDLLRLVKQQKQPLPIAQACDYVWQTALGLQHLHERGLVHRDIKPSNLLVTGLATALGTPDSSSGGGQSPPWGVVKILDLGLARLHRPIDEATAGLTANNALMMGTLDYMAPEQALDFHQVDIRADIYSLGCTFYYLLTARPPFPECTLAQKLHRHQYEEPTPAEQLRRDVPADLLPVLRKMMAKRPEDRYQTPGEIAQLLGAVSQMPSASERGVVKRGSLVPIAHSALLPATMRGPAPPPPSRLARVPERDGHFGPALRHLLQKLSAFCGQTQATRRRWLMWTGGGALLLGVMLIWLFTSGKGREGNQGTATGTRPNTQPPKEVDFNLWLGPAQERPFHANLVPYNWHWFWDFGNGDIGNQGVHEMDIARWAIPGATLPKSVISLGGRFGYTDQGETANSQIALMDFGQTQLIFEVRGLKTGGYYGQKIGNTFHFEEGVVAGGKFYRKGKENQPEPLAQGKTILRGPMAEGSGDGHFRNFIAAVRSRRVEELNADVLEGHYSSALCHLANISYRLGEAVPFNSKTKAFGDNKDANESLGRLGEHLAKDNGITLDDLSYRLGRKLTIDPKAESFVHDAEANRLLTREYRKPFEVPERV